MRTLEHRVNKLETTTHGKGRLIVLRTGFGNTDEDVARILQSRGIFETPADTVVCLNTIYMDREGSGVPSEYQPELLSVMPLK